MKGLIKHEVRNIKGLVIIWLIVILGVGLLCYLTSEDYYSQHIQYTYGYRTFSYIFTGSLTSYLFVMLVGIMVLVLNQFKGNKNEGVGDFLAALPYTQKQVYQTKLGVGGLLITGIHLLYSWIVIGIWMRNRSWLSENERIYPQPMSDDENALLIIIMVLLASYLIIIIMYLFMSLLQYIIYPTFGSLLVSILTFGAVTYMLLGTFIYYHEYLGMGSGSRLEDVAEMFMSLFVPIMNDEIHLVHYTVESFAPMGWRMIFSLLTISFLIVSIDGMSYKYGIAKQTRFIISDGFEWIFKIGVAVCSALLAFYLWILFGYSHLGIIRLELIAILLGIIGYRIARRMTQIGKQ